MTAFENLKQYFGYDLFRNGQETIINDILSGRDVLGIMPTGAGKSVCFQIPALMMDGLTLVVSPLISLMKDQVNALTQSGISAAFINSSLNERQIYMALQNARNGAYKLIYIAPERLLTSEFLSFAQCSKISMLTVDEAHCISQWGQDFRPSYAKIPEFIMNLPERPILSAFTATATPVVKKDIIDLLGLENPAVMQTGFDRQNLYFEVQKPRNKFFALTEFLKERKNRSGIVYCSTRATVEEVCENLNNAGYNASRYHAGLSDRERHENQDNFLYDRVQIMVATNAFGMGIDKSNVSFVVHYNMPKDIESYYQEAGRAGRDGEPSDCVLLYNGQDFHTNLWMIENANDVEYQDVETKEILKERSRKRLREMTFYCATSDCLRGYILKYFGEKPPHYCGNCGSCNTNFETADVTAEAQKIVSCVARMKERYGLNLVIDVLRGSKSEKVLRFGLDGLSTYGISEKSARQLHEIGQHLILSGYLYQTNEEYPIIKLGERANEVLRNGESVYMKLSKEQEQDKRYNSKQKKEKSSLKAEDKQTAVRPVDKRLFAVLQNVRLAIANEQNVPSFVIFPDSSLTDMCVKLPSTNEEFLKVSGVGNVKLEKYGGRFLNAITEFLNGNDINNVSEPPVEEKKEFDSSDVEITEEAVTVSAISDRINCALIASGHNKISGQRINDWLVSEGYMKINDKNGKNVKKPSETGEELGIKIETRVIRGEDLEINLFNAEAQRFIVLNTFKIADFKK